MIRMSNEISIDRPLGEVFKFVANLENLPKWNYYVQKVVKTSDGDALLGSEYHQIRKHDEQDLRIVEYIPNQLLIIETIPPSKPELRREMVFQTYSGNTQITDNWELDLGLPGLLEKAAATRIRSAVSDNLNKLKVLMESGRITLQDGRPMSISI